MGEKTTVEIYFLYTLPTSTQGPQKGFAIHPSEPPPEGWGKSLLFSRGSKTKVFNMAIPMPKAHIHSGLC